MLRRTGVAGHPESWFHKPDRAAWAGYLGLAPGSSLRDVLDAAVTAGRADSPVFALRLQQHSVDYFLEQLAAECPGYASDADRIKAAFGSAKYIYLMRQDTLAQAISRLKAEQTGLWHRAQDGSEIERLAPPADPVYDEQAIAHHMQEFKAMNRAWETWFAAQDISPLRVSYEQLCSEPGQTLQACLEFLDLPPAAARGITFDTMRLSDDISAEWAARFRAAQTRIA